MSAGEPWVWECGCGKCHSARDGFCWNCGKPAAAGTVLTGEAHAERARRTAGAHPGGDTLDVPEAADSGTTCPAPFRIVGADGRVLLSVSETPDGGALQLYNREGVPVVSLQVIDGGAVAITDRGGHRVAILAGVTEGGYLGLASPAGNRAVELRATAQGGAEVVYDAQGRPVSTSASED